MIHLHCIYKFYYIYNFSGGGFTFLSVILKDAVRRYGEKMKILVIGSGGREHALIYKLKQSPLCDEIFAAPSNAGISKDAIGVNISVEDIDALCSFAIDNQIGLTVVGPEVPLVAGIVDKFESVGLKVFGPNKECAAFEGSKALTKKFLMKHNVPTAAYKEAFSYEEAVSALELFTYPLVIKADGLAAGKGVFICQTKEEATKALEDVLNSKIFGESGNSVVIEEFLDGVETSTLCFLDGQTLIPMTSSKDYKMIYDNNEGPMTGGMGTFSPNPLVDEKLAEKIDRDILKPILDGFNKDSLVYKGVLYVGLMIVDSEPKVLEFNVRFGDPETQVLMLRLESDLVKIMLNCCDGILKESDIVWSDDYAVCVVLASGGYPGNYEKGKVISGLEIFTDEPIFHAGTKEIDGNITTNGGRVLNICAKGKTLEQARTLAYDRLNKISFDGKYYRSDIARISEE